MIKTIQIIPSINAEASRPLYSVTRLREAISGLSYYVALDRLPVVDQRRFN